MNIVHGEKERTCNNRVEKRDPPSAKREDNRFENVENRRRDSGTHKSVCLSLALKHAYWPDASDVLLSTHYLSKNVLSPRPAEYSLFMTSGELMNSPPCRSAPFHAYRTHADQFRLSFFTAAVTSQTFTALHQSITFVVSNATSLHWAHGPPYSLSCGRQVPDVGIPHYRDARMQHSQSR